MTALRPAAFFDRDGVINVDRGYAHRIDQFELVTGAAAALRACREAGMLIFIVTNQSGIARGMFGEEALARFHDHLRAALAGEGAEVDEIRYCPHYPEGSVAAYRAHCTCRKPAPGMLLDLIERWGIDRTKSFMIGDKQTDLDAAEAAGIEGHLFEGGDLQERVDQILRPR
jgi:D-glycero-D-manno-heptose 1,7-bisphosphate phosphatase